MLIDWFTVSAQTINFLVLIALLQRFLYKPVLNAIDTREKRIAEQLLEAERRTAQAQSEREGFQQRSAAIEHERTRLLQEARSAAQAEKQRLIEAARREAEELRARWTAALAEERSGLLERLANLSRTELLAGLHQALRDLADVGLEECITRVFLERLAHIPPPGPEGSAGAASAALVRSSFAIDPAQRAALLTGIRARWGAAREVRFETAPSVVCGIELSVDGLKLAWSVRDYLDQMNAHLTEALTRQEILARGEPIGP